MAHVDRNNPKRAASSDSQYSLMEFMRDFPDDATCLDWLWRTRYAEDGEHAFCEKCGKRCKFRRYETTQRRQSWTCTTCGVHVHPTAGTIYHKSSTSLHLWFYAIYLMTSTRCGISAKQLERELGVTYKTAWRMFHLIRNEFMEPDTDAVFEGEVEIDETYVGGKRKAGKGRKPAPRTPVLGVVERGGRVAATPVPNASSFELEPRVMKKVLPGSVIYSDEWGGYAHLSRYGYTHRRIKHSEGVYVSGNTHTQTIENFWSLVRRGITGVYHSVSAKHLQGYLNEYVWRYNHRDQDAAMFLTLLLRAAKP